MARYASKTQYVSKTKYASNFNLSNDTRFILLHTTFTHPFNNTIRREVVDSQQRPQLICFSKRNTTGSVLHYCVSSIASGFLDNGWHFFAQYAKLVCLVYFKFYINQRLSLDSTLSSFG